MKTERKNTIYLSENSKPMKVLEHDSRKKGISTVIAM